jgi:predicted permease
MFNIRLAFRTLFRTPFVAAVAIVSLALGIGANAAIFSIFNQVLLRPLPVPNPQELVNLATPGPKSGSTSCNNAGGCDEIFSYPMFRDMERGQTVLTGLAAHRMFGANIAYKGETSSVGAVVVSGSYFNVLGLTPVLGRLINPADDAVVGQGNVVVLSYPFWQTKFGSNPSVLNETLLVNGQPMTIVGVAPAGFTGTTLGAQPKIFVPITLRAFMEPGSRGGFDNRTQYWAYVFGRRKAGVSLEQARASLNQQYKNIIMNVETPLQKMSAATLERFKNKDLGVKAGQKGQTSVISDAFAPLVVLFGVTGIVLLSACANIANLLLARATRRAGEMAVRLSIGASRRHLITQLLGESVLLASLGGLAGLLVARWTLAAIQQLLPAEQSAMISFELDPGMLLFLAGVTLGTGLLFGLFPALHSSRPNLATTLKGTSGQPSGARSAKAFRNVLATSQIVLSMLLLGLAGLFTKSLVNVSRVDLGINTDRMITFSMSPQLNAYTAERSQALFARVQEELGGQPGVTGVSGARIALIANNNWGTNVSVQGFKADPDADMHSNFNHIMPGYFKTIGVPLLGGREFTETDTLGAPKVAIVNEQFAKKFNLMPNPVGKRMELGNAGKLDVEIVGFVKNAKYSEVKGEIPALFFTPYRQEDHPGSISFYARVLGDPVLAMGVVRGVVKRIDPDLPVEDLRTMTEQVSENVFLDRFVTTLSAAFAGLATLLAAVGLYGVLAYTVAQRTREFGLRMALGADPARVRDMVLRQVALMLVIGGVVGLALAALTGWAAGSLLYQIKGWDPVILASTAAFLAVIAFAAGYLPARRASRVDPMRALRYE